MRRAGGLRIDVVSDGTFLLDGGAMFGVVPKTIWAGMRPPDDSNRIVIALNSLLIRSDEGWTAVVDTGMGDKWSPRMADIFGIDRGDGLVGSLARHGVSPPDVTHVLFTHLHLDHAGGNTSYDDQGGPVPVFPNARHVVQRGEWDDALSGHPALRESYVEDDLLPLAKAGLLDFVEGDTEVLPGIRSIVTGGHTSHHQILLIGEGAERIAFMADLFPTTSHLKPHYHMAYDLFPMTVAEKRAEIAARAIDEDWLCVFEHDATTVAGRIRRDGKSRLHVVPEEF